jgi:putative PIN family toxin of toxin-antitoxin system
VFLAFYRMKGLPAEIKEHITDCKDETNNRFLSLAVAANADILVSGDRKHLLLKPPYRGVQTNKAADFLEE